MSYQRERDYFMAQVAPTLGVPNARALLACATTLQRLAEAQCNGNWPCDNGERKVVPCPLCDSLWVPSQIQGGSFAKLAHRMAGGRCACGPCLRCPADASNLSPAACLCAHAAPRACPDCRAEARAHSLVEGSPYQVVTQGDPRGAVLSLYERSATREDIDRGTARRIYVPTR